MTISDVVGIGKKCIKQILAVRW